MAAKSKAAARRPPITIDAGDGMFNPQLAYTLEQLDPSSVATRAEGELRHQPLRAALRMLAREHPRLLEAQADDGLAAALTPAPALQSVVHDALLNSAASWKPRVCLHAPTARVFEPELADAMADLQRVQCVPIKNSDRVAFPQWPLPLPRRVLVEFPRRRLGVGEAWLQLERVDEDRVVLTAVSTSNQRTRISGTVGAVLLERLFTPLFPSLEDSTIVPTAPGELPGELLYAIADFWQREMRAHVVAAVCAPDDATRPFALESVRVRREGERRRATVRCVAHRSSLSCACALHKRAPIERLMPSEKFVGSSVEFTLQMCGRPLDRSSGFCPLHGSATPDVPLVRDVCCHGTVASMRCVHRTESKARHDGLVVHDLHLRGIDVTHAQVLVAAATRSVDTTTGLLGKRSRAEIEAAWEPDGNDLRLAAAELARLRATAGHVHTMAELEALDCLATDLLTEGGVRQHVRPTSQERALLRIDEAERQVILGAETGAALVEKHYGLFPPPPRAAKSRRR